MSYFIIGFFLMLILGFACKVKGYRASNNELAVSWKHLE